MTPGLAAAGLTAFFYGITPVCARRAIRLLGYVKANLAAWPSPGRHGRARVHGGPRRR